MGKIGGLSVRVLSHFLNKLLGIAVMNMKRATIITRQWLIYCVLGLVGLGVSSSAMAATLTDVSYSTLRGNAVQVQLKFDGAVPDISSYSIDKPARISLDLAGTSSALTKRNHTIGVGVVRGLTAVEADGRTRVVFNLSKPATYNTSIQGDSLFVQIGNVGDQVAQVVAPAAVEKTPEPAPTPAPEPEPAPAPSIQQPPVTPVAVADKQPAYEPQRARTRVASANRLTKIDFRRGEEGEGRVLISLGSSSMPVDVSQQGSRLVVKFAGASVPNELLRRLDVGDFGTPVRVVETRKSGNSAVMTIESAGDWEYIAYQANDLFTIDVKEINREAERNKRPDYFYSGERLSLNFQNIEVRSVLQLIADFTDLNLVASDTVSGSITLRLQNVPWDQALDLILKTKGLDKRQVGNVLLVAPAQEIAAREQQELESQRQLETLAPLRTEYIRVNYAVARDMEALIKAESNSLLSSRGSVAVDERTNTLIVNDTAAKLDEIRDVLRHLDVAVQQVLIEARVVIATSDLTDELGITWGGRRTTSVGSGSLEMAGGLANNMIVDFGRENNNSSSFTLGFTDKKSNLLDLEIFALASEGFGEVVATPKVLTADQQSAEIASGKEIPYQSSSGNQGTNTEFKEAELLLRVTPRITPEGRINMELEITNDSVGEIFGGVPSIDTNRVETVVLVDDGETVVLGGIFQQTRNEGTYKTPFFGDLPWVGRLFRRDFSNSKKAELLVFITPRLVKEGFASQ